MSRLAPRVLSVALASLVFVTLYAAAFTKLDTAASAAPANNHKKARGGRASGRGSRTSKKKKKCTAEPFVAGCALPFENAVSHPVDEQCPLQGNCQSGAGSLLQNKIKNNYCA